MNLSNPNHEPTLPSLQQIEGALLEIKEHNSNHTGLSRAMSSMFGLMLANAEPIDINEHTDSEAEASPAKKQLQPEEKIDIRGEGEVSEDLLGLTADPVIEKIGLSRFGGEAAFSGGEQVTASSQEPAITQPNLFGEFLQSASGHLDETPTTKLFIEKAYWKLIWMVKESGRGEDEFHQTGLRLGLDMLEKLQPSYAKLVESDDLSLLPLETGQALLTWGNRPEFTEYIKASDLGLTEEGYNAATWALDLGNIPLNDRWNGLFEHYDSIVKKYGTDNDLAVLVRQKMQDALNATANLAQNPLEAWSDGYALGVRQQFKPVRQKAMVMGLIGDPNMN